MLALILTLALGQVDAGTPAVDAPIIVLDVVEGALVVREEKDGVVTKVPQHVGDGCYLPTESCVRAGKEKAREHGKLEEANKVGMKWLGVAFGAGALTGLAIGLVAGFVTRGGK